MRLYAIRLWVRVRFDNTNERYTGMLGMHGTKTSNLGVMKSDLLIALGTRFSDRVLGNPKKFAENAKVLHIDVDPAEVNKNIRVDYSIIGDVKEVLKMLNEKLDKCDHSEWMDFVKDMKAKMPLSYDMDRLTGPAIVSYINEATDGDAIVTTDVGQHQDVGGAVL